MNKEEVREKLARLLFAQAIGYEPLESGYFLGSVFTKMLFLMKADQILDMPELAEYFKQEVK